MYLWKTLKKRRSPRYYPSVFASCCKPGGFRLRFEYPRASSFAHTMLFHARNLVHIVEASSSTSDANTITSFVFRYQRMTISLISVSYFFDEAAVHRGVFFSGGERHCTIVTRKSSVTAVVFLRISVIPCVMPIQLCHCPASTCEVLLPYLAVMHRQQPHFRLCCTNSSHAGIYESVHVDCLLFGDATLCQPPFWG